MPKVRITLENEQGVYDVFEIEHPRHRRKVDPRDLEFIGYKIVGCADQSEPETLEQTLDLVEELLKIDHGPALQAWLRRHSGSLRHVRSRLELMTGRRKAIELGERPTGRLD